MEALMWSLEPFSEWLLRTTLQASLLILLILLVQYILGDMLGIRWRYCLWLLLLVRMVLPWAPQSRISIFNLIPAGRQQVSMERGPSDVPDYRADSGPVVTQDGGQAPGTPAEASQTVPQPTRVSLQMPQEAEADLEQPAVMESPSDLQSVSDLRRGRFEIGGLLPLVWLGGVVALAGFVCVGNFSLWRIVKRERCLTDQRILELVEDCKSQMAVQTVLGVVATDRVKSPALFGFVRPRLLLPKKMIEELGMDELRHVFLHELAHLRRHDIFVGYLVSVLQILHWFNPLVWLAFHRLGADRELACDALALSTMDADESAKYGRTVVHLLEDFLRPRRLPSLAGISEDKSRMKRRITMIARFKKSSYRWSPPAVVLLIILGCVSLPDAKRDKSSEVSPTEPVRKMTLQKVWAGEGVDICGSPSPDGRYLSCVDWETGDLAVYEIAAGKKRHLTNKGTWDDSNEFAEFSRWSPDGKQIVYGWYNKDDFIELRIVGLDGSKARILHRDEKVTWARAYAWSPDGSRILACFSSKDGERIVLVSVADGSVRVLKTLERYPNNMSFSPDGDYVVYDFLPKEDSPERDISVLLTDGSREIPLIEHPADDRVLDWAPDGRHILFASDRTGAPCMWLIAVADGKPRGTLKLVKSDIGQKFTSMGFTEDGSFYYGCGGIGASDVLVGKLDPQTGEVLVRPTKIIQRFEGYNRTPDYSPDGKHLAYVSNRGRRHFLCIRSLETGLEREFPSEFRGILEPRWSPDGGSILVACRDFHSNRFGHYLVDAKTGAFTVALPPPEGFKFYAHEWSSDGKSLFLARSSGEDKVSQIILREIESGKEIELYHESDLERFPLARSPDGKWLAFMNIRNNGVLRIIPSGGGEPRELYKCDQKKEQLITLRWAADGKHILFVIREFEQDKLRLWRIPFEGGEPQKIGLDINIRHLSVHPDGEHIAFSTLDRQPGEVWVMENFLPDVRRTKASGISTAELSHQPHFRKIRIPTEISWDAQLSPDGKKVTLASDGKLWIMPLSGRLGPDFPGAPVELNTEGVRVEGSGHAWSADGRDIAFNQGGSEQELEAKKGVQGIYIVSSKGGKPKKIHETYRDHRTVNYRIDLSPDGKTLAFSSVDLRASEQHIYTISLGAKVPKRLVSTQAREPVFSPDGSMVAYVEDKNLGRAGGGLWVVPAKGGTPKHIVDAVNASSPVWSPEGDMIAFLDYGGERNRVNVIPVGADGKRVGDLITIDAPEGIEKVYFLTGWSSDGKIGAIFERPREIGLFTLAVGGGKAVQIARGGSQPRWSPDGNRIIHVRDSNGQSGDWRRSAIASIPAEGGAAKIVPIQSDVGIHIMPFGTGNRLSPDGSTVVFSGRTQKEAQFRHMIWTLPVEGGTPKPLTKPSEQATDFFPCWSPDGKMIAFVRGEFSDNPVEVIGKANICSVSVNGGEPKPLTSQSDNVSFGPITWSPDGKLLVYFARQRHSEDGTLNVISADGGEPRIVGNVRNVVVGKELAWSPDGTRIAFNGPRGKVIKVISLADGSIVDIDPGLVDRGIGHLDWSPDGERFVFVGAKGETAEFWVMENFLPEAVAADK